MSAPNHIEVTAAMHDSEWRVRVELPGQGQVFLTAPEAKDASQRLYHLSLEISEREGQPQGADAEAVLRKKVKELKDAYTAALKRIGQLENEVERLGALP